MTINILGAGAFGTSLAIALAQQEDVVLWARSQHDVSDMRKTRKNVKRLAGFTIPENVAITGDIDDIAPQAPCLLAVPTQQLAGFIRLNKQALENHDLIACCKGIDLTSDLGPVGILNNRFNNQRTGILSGPSFAADLATGLPTALTLAMTHLDRVAEMQERLSTPQIRLYATDDWRGVELGGALKNVMAIACGVVRGAQLGESARAAILTRGFAEMRSYCAANGANPDTLMGLSGLGDLTLTASSEKSRNFRYGIALGRGEAWTSDETVEGRSTAQAVANTARQTGIDLPLVQTVALLVNEEITVQEALAALMARPLKREI